MVKRTPEGEALTNLILETFRLNGAMLSAGNRLTKSLGMTSARWQVMGAIDRSGQPMTVAQIARRMGLARQGVQRIANDLDRLGMVTFEENVDHKRAPLVSISDSGRDVMNQIDEAQAEWVNELADGVGARRLTQAISVMERIRIRTEESRSEVT